MKTDSRSWFAISWGVVAGTIASTFKTMNAEDFFQGTDKNMAVRYFWVCQLLDRGEIRIQYVRSAENLADICTKIQGPQSMTNACQLLNMRSN